MPNPKNLTRAAPLALPALVLALTVGTPAGEAAKGTIDANPSTATRRAPALEREGLRDERAERLIERLGSPRFEDRQAAERELAAMGLSAVPALMKASRHEDPEVAARARQAWKTITPLRVTLVHDKQEYLLGENIFVHYCVRNVGDRPAPYGKGGFYPGLRYNDGYVVTAVEVDETGKPLGPPVTPIERPPNRGGPCASWQLVPGKRYEQTLYLPRYLRLTRAGRFRIRIVNVDRMNPKRRYSLGETTLTLKLPTAEQAREVYERMKKLPREPIAGISERRDQEVADFDALLHPVYLPVLTAFAQKGDREALAGIGKMHTAESTEALVSLIDRGLRADDVDLALSAYDRMAERLPNPRFYQYEKTDPTTHKRYAERREFVRRTWRDKFAKTLRRLASRLARGRETESLGTISYILECVGVAEDMPDLILGYTKSIEATKTLPFETHQYFRPRGSAYGFRFSTRQLLARGAHVPTNPKTAGEMAAYLIAMQARKDFRPADWPKQVARWLKADPPYIREFVLEHMPDPIPAAALDLLSKLLADEYVDLQIAACRTAAKHPREEFREPILKILKTETEQYLLNAATEAAGPNGITQDQVMDIWVGRIEGDLGGKAVARLLDVIDYDGAGAGRTDLPADDAKEARANWAHFIDQHRARLKAGRRFNLNDPEITPDLFPSGFYIYLNGSRWPPNDER